MPLHPATPGIHGARTSGRAGRGTTHLEVDRLRARYSVAPGGDERRRLDGVLGLVVDEELEPALARAGQHDRGELVCVRRVSAPIELTLARQTDRALATSWADAIAGAIADRVRGGGADVVRFGSQRHALADMAACVAHGDARREWAWRAAGAWPPQAAGQTPARALVIGLLADPPAIAPVLSELARAGTLPGLAAALAPTAWIELAVAALEAAGAVRALAERAVLEAPASQAPFAVRRALRSSAIAAALAGGGAPGSAVAALALAEAEPAAVARLGASLAGALPAALQPQAPPAGALAPPQGTDAAAPATAEHPDEPVDGAPRGAAPEDGAEPQLPERPSGRTNHGGLVFALHAVAGLDICGRLAGDLPDVELPRALHALALALLRRATPGDEPDPADPAALMLAGLAPDADPPPPVAGEAIAPIECAAEAVSDWLAGRLEIAAAELDLQGLLDRRAWIVADPGWIEVHLLMDEIDTAVRRAGLDLDPDHLPFLGCVVRIVYA